VIYGAENLLESPRKFRSGKNAGRFWKWLGEYI